LNKEIKNDKLTEEEIDKLNTSIQVTVGTRNRLKGFKIHPKETYNDMFIRWMNEKEKEVK
jgi:hypothetical protein